MTSRMTDEDQNQTHARPAADSASPPVRHFHYPALACLFLSITPEFLALLIYAGLAGGLGCAAPVGLLILPIVSLIAAMRADATIRRSHGVLFGRAVTCLALAITIGNVIIAILLWTIMVNFPAQQ